MRKTDGRGAMGLVTALLAAFSGVSCGSSNDGGACATPSPCGGDIVGTWTVTSSCFHIMGTGTVGQCSTAMVTEAFNVTGQASYNADLTYTLNLQGSFSDAIVLPASCVTTSCADIDQMLQVSPPLGITSIHCSTASGGGCDCTAALPSQADFETGTYTLAGTSITTTASGGGTATDPYCVMGNHLDLMPTETDLSPGTTQSGAVVFTKQ